MHLPNKTAIALKHAGVSGAIYIGAGNFFSVNLYLLFHSGALLQLPFHCHSILVLDVDHLSGLSPVFMFVKLTSLHLDCILPSVSR